MIVLSIIEVLGHSTKIFAEYDIQPVNGSFKWTLSPTAPVQDGRLCFSDIRAIKAGDRVFKVLLNDPQNLLPTAVKLELVVPNKESGLYGEGCRITNTTRFEFLFKNGNSKTNMVCLVDELIADSEIVLHLTYLKGPTTVLRFPIFIQPDADALRRYRFMKQELESEGLFSFIYDELKGVFSNRRLSLEWKAGGTALAQKDSWVERTAIHEMWKWLFDKALPDIIQFPAYDIKNTTGAERITRVHRPLPATFRKLPSQRSDNNFVVSKVRRRSFAIPAHVVIVSFVKRLIMRLEEICVQLDDQITDAQNRKSDEINGEWGKSVKPVIRSIEGEIEDLQFIVTEERKQLEAMTGDIRKLASSIVFSEAFFLPKQSIFDIDPACFSFNSIYRETRRRILDFDSQFYNWYARSNDSSLRARPVDSTQDPGESIYQWKYSKVYQFWCYYHFVRAAVSIGLHPVQVNRFESHDGSWISFETKDSAPTIRLSLFHEVKGYTETRLWQLASKPLPSEKWCVGHAHDDDPNLTTANKWKYLTPDFVLKIEGASKRPFLIVLDAKSYPWSPYHDEAQRKYRSFCQYLKGYHYKRNSILDPSLFVQSIQSWIIFSDAKYKGPELSVSGAWSMKSNRLSFPGQWGSGCSLDTSKVCLGRISGNVAAGVDNSGNYKKPFEDFLRMQIDYYRNDYPALLS